MHRFRITIPDNLVTPMSSKMLIFLSSVKKKLSFLRKTSQDF